MRPANDHAVPHRPIVGFEYPALGTQPMAVVPSRGTGMAAVAAVLMAACGGASVDPTAPRTYTIDDTTDPGWVSGAGAYEGTDGSMSELGDLTASEAELEVRRRVSLPGGEQLQVAGRIQRHVSQATRRIGELRERKRHDGAMVEYVCLDETLRELDQARRMVGQRLEALDTAVREDDESRHHEYRILVVLGERVGALEQRALDCAVTPEVRAGS